MEKELKMVSKTGDIEQAQIAYMEASGPIRIVNDSLNIIGNTKNLNTLKSRVAVMDENLQRLLEIEARGYRFTERSAGEIRDRMWDSVNERILELSKEEHSNILLKKDSYASVKSAITAISRIQQKLIDLRESLYKNATNYEAVKEKIQALHDKLKEEVTIGQFKEIFKKADKEDFKGNTKKAKDLYLEALHFLKTSGIDISRIKKEAEQIEAKISNPDNRS